jgi:hypothetical protein
MSFVTGMYLEDASDVPELKAKYFTRPGQHTLRAPCNESFHQLEWILL